MRKNFTMKFKDAIQRPYEFEIGELVREKCDQMKQNPQLTIAKAANEYITNRIAEIGNEEEELKVGDEKPDPKDLTEEQV